MSIITTELRDKGRVYCLNAGSADRTVVVVCNQLGSTIGADAYVAAVQQNNLQYVHV